MLTYGWAHDAIYGPSQHAVTQVRATAKRKPATLAKFQRRPARVWIGRSKDDRSGSVAFTSKSKHGTVTRAFHVPTHAVDGSRQWWPPREPAGVE
jgi:hypothetical protein